MRLFVILTFLMLGTMPALAVEQTACEKIGFLREKPKGCPDDPNNKAINEIVTCVENGETFYLCKKISTVREYSPDEERIFSCFKNDRDWETDECISVSASNKGSGSDTGCISSKCGSNPFCCSYDQDNGVCQNTVCVNTLETVMKATLSKETLDKCSCVVDLSYYDFIPETLCDCGDGAKHL